MKIFILFFIFLFLTACSNERKNYDDDTNLVCGNEYAKDRFIFKINVERENFAIFFAEIATSIDDPDPWFRWGTNRNQLQLPYCCATVTTTHILLGSDYATYKDSFFILNRETLELSNTKKNRQIAPKNYYQCRIVSETESKALRELKIKEELEQFNKEKVSEEEQKKNNKI